MPKQTRTTVAERLPDVTRYRLVVDGKETQFVAKEIYKNNITKWYPFKLYPNPFSPEKRYSYIEFIGTDFNKVPAVGFSRNINSGFGFTKDQGVDKFFRYLEEHIKEKIVGVMFTESETRLRQNVLYLNINDFFKINLETKLFVLSKRAEQENIHQSESNKILPNEFPPPPKLRYISGALGRFLGKYSEESIHLSQDESQKLLPKLDIDSQAIISTRRTIEKRYIEDVLSDYKSLMSLKSDTENLEEKWHTFFRKHPWIFSSVFAYPAAYFKDKLNIGGYDITGGTNKIIDFLIRNKFTKNITFIEIKTHLTSLVNRRAYRNPGIFSVSSHVTGAIVQVIDQRTTFLKSYNSIRGDEAVDSLNSNCLIIVGHTSELSNPHKIRSFELFRLSNKDVSIVTFDELQEKMEALIKIFTQD